MTPLPTPPTGIAAALSQAERSIAALSKALLLGQQDLVENAARDLQLAALGLSGQLQGIGAGQGALNPLLGARLRQVGHDIALQREACARRGAAVEHALHSILPAARPSTYAAVPSPYARNARQSGAFKLLVA